MQISVGAGLCDSSAVLGVDSNVNPCQSNIDIVVFIWRLRVVTARLPINIMQILFNVGNLEWRVHTGVTS